MQKRNQFNNHILKRGIGKNPEKSPDKNDSNPKHEHQIQKTRHKIAPERPNQKKLLAITLLKRKILGILREKPTSKRIVSN